MIDNEIYAITVSNKLDREEMKYIINSCNKQKNKLNIIGLNRPFDWIKRLQYYIEELERLDSISTNSIAVLTDAYDVFYTDTLNNIKHKFIKMDADIVFSCERWYSHQIKSIKIKHDDNAKLYGSGSQYRYVCAGCYIGYIKPLIIFLKSILDEQFIEKVSSLGGEKYFKLGLDQCLMGYYVSENINNDDIKIKLDYGCKIFYTPTEDWDNLTACIHSINKYKPAIVHVPWKARYFKVLSKLYNYIYDRHYTS